MFTLINRFAVSRCFFNFLYKKIDVLDIQSLPYFFVNYILIG